jgi:hypothetical protein
VRIDLDFVQWCGPLSGFGCAPTIDSDPIMLPQNLPDGLCRARQANAFGQSFAMTWQVIEQRSRPWHPLEILRGLIAQVEDALHHLRGRRGRGRMTSARAAPQHLLIIGRRLFEALAPFLDPTF